MLTDGISFITGSAATNFAVASGATFPTDTNSVGELFYLTSGETGLYVFDGTDWQPTTTGEVSFDSLNVKAAVRVATTGNITLSGVQTIDGVVLAAGDRVLVKNQTDASQNGIYVVVAAAPWTRASDFDGSPTTEVRAGDFAFVTEGSTQADTGWVLTTNGAIQVGTTALTFAQFTGGAGGGSFTGGTVTSPVVIASAQPQLTVGTPTLEGQVVSAQGASANTGGLRIQAGGTTVGAAATLQIRGGTAPSGQATGNINIVSEAAGGSGTGGTISITAGGTSSGSAGTVTVTGGLSASSNGGNASLVGGNTATGSFGGSVTLQGGNRTGSGGARGGDINLQAGSGGTGTAQGGLIDIRAGNGGSSSGATAGNVQITAGGVNQGTAGNVVITAGVGTSAGGYISLQTPATASPTERLRILNNGAWSVGTGGTATGTSGQVLTSNGNSSAPTWQNVTASWNGGTVTSPVVINTATTPQLQIGASGGTGVATILASDGAGTNVGGGLTIKSGSTTSGKPTAFTIETNVGNGGSSDLVLRTVNGVTFSGNVAISTGNGGTANSGSVSITTGTGSSVGGITISTGATTGPAGSITISAGGKNGGTGGSGGGVSISAGSGSVSGSGGGDITLTAGSSSGSATSGNVSISAGGATIGTPGDVIISAGGRTGAAAGTGGAVTITGGTGGSSNDGVGGDITIRPGNGGTGGPGGNLELNGGTGGIGGTGGYISFRTAAANTFTERFRILRNGAWSVGTAGTATGTAGQVLASTGATTPPVWSAQVYDFNGFYAGSPTADAQVFAFVVTRNFTLPANLANSRVISTVAATASTVLSIRKNGTQFATATFAAAGTTATLSSSLTTFVAGDIITVVAPSTADATLANIAMTFVSTLT